MVHTGNKTACMAIQVAKQAVPITKASCDPSFTTSHEMKMGAGNGDTTGSSKARAAPNPPFVLVVNPYLDSIRSKDEIDVVLTR